MALTNIANLYIELKSSFQPFSLEFKPLLDDIATHERELKKLAGSVAVMTVISMSPLDTEMHYHFSNTEFVLQTIQHTWRE